ncbi:HIT family protein [Actinomyces sp. 2119]|uniref:HIT family protein n=1 Tax=Actinomyces lilanjuaniae TaxID=2321394 RepID=A0ABM6Z3W5_9ACTO|nr:MULTISPECIES: HIT family protein [Actinomyces]AYD89988.1 HIT family protein [Actinomyces lilanjuaniae]RJF42471.1 HIT family protein [Actinomyces sp. 2119]
MTTSETTSGTSPYASAAPDAPTAPGGGATREAGGAGPTLFTRIINGEVPGRFVWADELCVAFATIEPHTDGHVLVVPRHQVDSFTEAPEDLVAHLAVVARRVGATQTRVFQASRAGLVVAGYGVDHLHLHVLPIRSEADLSFSSARHDVPGEELDAAMERLRAGLREDGWGEFVPSHLGSPSR